MRVCNCMLVFVIPYVKTRGQPPFKIKADNCHVVLCTAWFQHVTWKPVLSLFSLVSWWSDWPVSVVCSESLYVLQPNPPSFSDLFNALMSPERYWQGLTVRDMGAGGNCMILMLHCHYLLVYHRARISSRAWKQGRNSSGLWRLWNEKFSLVMITAEWKASGRRSKAKWDLSGFSSFARHSNGDKLLFWGAALGLVAPGICKELNWTLKGPYAPRFGLHWKE